MNPLRKYFFTAILGVSLMFIAPSALHAQGEGHDGARVLLFLP